MSARQRGVGKQPGIVRSADGSLSSTDEKNVKPKKGSCRRCCCCLNFGLLITTGLFAVVLYLLPSPIDPVSFKFSDSADGPPPLTGVFTPNNELKKAKRLFEGELVGAEAFAADKDGFLYTGLIDGRVVKINPETETYNVLTRMGDPPYTAADCGKFEKMPTCGRPLGLQIDKEGSLLLVDSYKGLFRINTKSGEKKLLFEPEKTGDLSCTFINNLAVHSNGSIFISCSSAKFALHDYMLDSMEARASGKVFHYNPIIGQTTLLKKDLYSANGIALSSGEDFLVVSELTRARLLRYHLKGPNVGTWETLVDNLPAIIDNITPTRHTPGFWLAGPAVRYGTMLDFVSDKPWIRLITAKLQLMNIMEQVIPRHTVVMMINEEGSVIRFLQDQTGETVYKLSEAYEFEGALYLGSYVAPFIGKLKL